MTGWASSAQPCLMVEHRPASAPASAARAQPLPITGYNIVDADSLDAAKALCDNHPFLADAPADFSVDVYELTPMM